VVLQFVITRTRKERKDRVHCFGWELVLVVVGGEDWCLFWSLSETWTCRESSSTEPTMIPHSKEDNSRISLMEKRGKEALEPMRKSRHGFEKNANKILRSETFELSVASKFGFRYGALCAFSRED